MADLVAKQVAQDTDKRLFRGATGAWPPLPLRFLSLLLRISDGALRYKMSRCEEKFTIFLVLIVVLAPFGAQTDC